MERILFIFIGTGKYCELARNAIVNFKENLNPDGFGIKYLFLTDQNRTGGFNQIPDDVLVRYAPHLPFPLPTLLRYHFFVEHKQILSNYDYIYFINADMRIQSRLSVTELLPGSGYNLVGVSHPGFHALNGACGTFETNPRSEASLDSLVISHNNGVTGSCIGLTEKYIIGAFQGGRKKEFIEMCENLKKAIDIDLKNNYIAIWHDESHLQKYAQTVERFQVLPPTYCQPEGWPLFGETKILKLAKNHEAIRS